MFPGMPLFGVGDDSVSEFLGDSCLLTFPNSSLKDLSSPVILVLIYWAVLSDERLLMISLSFLLLDVGSNVGWRCSSA